MLAKKAMKFFDLFTNHLFLFAFCLLPSCPSTESKQNSDNNVFVTTQYGTLRGFKTKFLNAKEVDLEEEAGDVRAVNIFRGIPFARPPVRFEVRIFKLSIIN